LCRHDGHAESGIDGTGVFILGMISSQHPSIRPRATATRPIDWKEEKAAKISVLINWEDSEFRILRNVQVLNGD
jgi:hypothetical protein